MSYPREVWIAEEEVLIALYYEWNAQADIVSTANITLSATGATVDGQTVSPGNIVLATSQTVSGNNGLYLVPNSGAWVALNPLQPQVVEVLYGTTYAGTKWNLSSANTYTNVAATYYDPTPVRTELYCQNLAIDPKNQIVKHRQPGALRPDVKAIPEGMSISCTAFYEKKAEQWTPYLDATKKFRFDWSLVNPRYSGSSPEENDDHAYRNCAVADQKITRSDNQVVEVALQLEAEYQE